jgi:oligopeptide/dipeptide ABC transporter ATP-binding protein
MITHDLGVVAQTCDKVAVLYGGIVAEEADVFSLFGHPSHPYTRALLRSMPRIGDDSPFQPIPGAAIQIRGQLASCPFAPRCDRTQDICRTALPHVRSLGPTLVRCHHPIEEQQ